MAALVPEPGLSSERRGHATDEVVRTPSVSLFGAALGGVTDRVVKLR